MDPTSLPKVLYIDDTPEARQLVRRLLSQSYIVLEAKDAISGIELALDTRPDLILLDVNLPEMSGREVATRLRSLMPNIPLVALTADTSPGARERALAAGFWGFMNKPITVDTFEEDVQAYLHGKRDALPDSARHVQLYQAELVEHLESKVRELTKTAERNEFLNDQNQHIIAVLRRRQRMMEAAARIANNVASILELDTLLSTSVDIICEEYEFYYAGIFLVDSTNEWATLKAGRGEAGKKLISASFRLKIDEKSMIGRCISQRKALIALDVDEERARFKNPLLPETRSEMALPLSVQDTVLGALTVQSAQVNAFSEEDIAALQILADQVAIAIKNAQLLNDLEMANRELVRQKTFEAIATATGEAIHWVGNKAAPILPSAERVQADLLNLAAMLQTLLKLPAEERSQHFFWPVVQEALESAQARGHNLQERSQYLATLPSHQLMVMGSLESILEDLEIIHKSADTILNIKEDLIGPVRLAHPTALYLPEFLREVVNAMGLPQGVVHTKFAADLPPARGDARQLANVFNNLIKNAWEALEGRLPGDYAAPQIWVSARPAKEQGFVQVLIKDNGPGIPPEIQDKIWVSFFTTKGGRGGTGLGLFSCMEIIRQAGGKIWVNSQVGQGATFNVLLPIAKDEASASLPGVNAGGG